MGLVEKKPWRAKGRHINGPTRLRNSRTITYDDCHLVDPVGGQRQLKRISWAKDASDHIPVNTPGVRQGIAVRIRGVYAELQRTASDRAQSRRGVGGADHGRQSGN